MGKPTSKRKTYYESRSNRSDVTRPALLETGGGIKVGTGAFGENEFWRVTHASVNDIGIYPKSKFSKQEAENNFKTKYLSGKKLITGGGVENKNDIIITNKELVLYHYTNIDKPIISNKEDRLIPNSLSASPSSGWSFWGENKFKIILPKNIKILKVDKKTFWNYGKETDTPLNRGKEIYKRAIKEKVDVIFLDKIGGQPPEYCILNNNFKYEKISEENSSEMEKAITFYENGGGLEEEDFDLFEDFDNLPQDVQDIFFEYEDIDDTYERNEEMLSRLKPLGYTFDYGLDSVPFGLKKMATGGGIDKKIIVETYKGKLEYNNQDIQEMIDNPNL